MGENYFHVDAFTGEGLLGNPAGVCLLSQPLSSTRMQQIANELSLPETSFVWPEQGKYGIRWFTPNREVDLCGHATLATAHVLLNVLQPMQLQQCHFLSASGELLVTRDQADAQRLQLDFPARPAERISEPAQLSALLGAKVLEVWQAKAMMVVLATEAEVRQLQPDIRHLIAQFGCGVIVTAPGEQVDFVSRYFSLDGSEDPVTGSAHCTLLPYWAERLGRNTLHAKQLSARGGELFCQLLRDRVLLGGYAQLFLRGTLAL
ncbi:PhzF family phenazine biosynthesis protein [Serratia microhaemolytica]|uniref:PhzF family phenazine biosynthesis protein n=1 Tax=Serratia microhaemolytica TaxID=2675110 RepID=UPI000FDE222F|nr:PhzF family phenazine biosynthesis protein [Serratia microhaemolytica]